MGKITLHKFDQLYYKPWSLFGLFALQGGVRHGDPLSPYLFIMVIEPLSGRIKYDPDIDGIKVNDSEFLIWQYADDSSLTLDDSEKSLIQALCLLDKFY